VIDGAVNPTTGLIDPSLNVDMRITLGDPAGTVLDIDLRPQDMATVQTVLDRINSQASSALAAAGLPANAFQATLAANTNGITFVQDPSFTNRLSVAPVNNSPAVEQLGLLNGRYDAATSAFLAEDRAKVRVDNLFTHLTDLRDALLSNDTRGIGIAGENIERVVGSVAEVRGLIGGYAQRLESASTREESRATLDDSIRSQLRDSDFAEAATRLSLLQTQLQAGLQVTSISQQQTLLDFLG
jgi:flagellin-like hook-associated protein FlgL